jgi:hypothetical protein
MVKKAKKRMGRPPKPPDEKWKARVMVNMTEAERDQLVADAKRARLSLSAYLLGCWKDRRA